MPKNILKIDYSEKHSGNKVLKKKWQEKCANGKIICVRTENMMREKIVPVDPTHYLPIVPRHPRSCVPTPHTLHLS